MIAEAFAHSIAVTLLIGLAARRSRKVGRVSGATSRQMPLALLEIVVQSQPSHGSVARALLECVQYMRTRLLTFMRIRRYASCPKKVRETCR